MGLRQAKFLLQKSDDFLIIAEVEGNFSIQYANDDSFGLLLNVAINSPQFRLILNSVCKEAKEFLENMPDEE